MGRVFYGSWDRDRTRENPENAEGAKGHRDGNNEPVFLLSCQFEFKEFSSWHGLILYITFTAKILAN